MAGTNSPGYPGVIAGRNTTTEVPDDIGMDQDSRAMYVGTWVWNTETLEWEKQQSSEVLFGELTSMLHQLISELKIMNTHLQIITGNDIKDFEVE